jgi:hypothetical protein
MVVWTYRAFLEFFSNTCALLTSPVGAAVLVVHQLGREVGDGAGDAHVLCAVGTVAIPWPRRIARSTGMRKHRHTQ